MKTFRWPVLVGALIGLVIGFFIIKVNTADAHYYDACKKYTCKAHVIQPFRSMFMKIAYCETGGTMNWRIHNESGSYHGGLQFDLVSWRGAGGYGDPHTASKTEQLYRGVIWLHRNGRGAWPNC